MREMLSGKIFSERRESLFLRDCLFFLSNSHPRRSALNPIAGKKTLACVSQVFDAPPNWKVQQKNSPGGVKRRTCGAREPREYNLLFGAGPKTLCDRSGCGPSASQTTHALRDGKGFRCGGSIIVESGLSLYRSLWSSLQRYAPPFHQRAHSTWLTHPGDSRSRIWARALYGAHFHFYSVSTPTLQLQFFTFNLFALLWILHLFARIMTQLVFNFKLNLIFIGIWFLYVWNYFRYRQMITTL